IDNNSARANFDIGGLNGNQLLPDRNRGLSDFDLRHRLVATFVYRIPGPQSGLWNRLLGNWTMSGMTTLQSGFPGSVFQSIGNPLSGSNGRADLVPGCHLVNPGSVRQHLDNVLNANCAQLTPSLLGGTTFGPLSPYEGPGDQMFTITPNGSGRLQGHSGRGV